VSITEEQTLSVSEHTDSSSAGQTESLMFHVSPVITAPLGHFPDAISEHQLGVLFALVMRMAFGHREGTETKASRHTRSA
jgi:hypothetical protein